MSVIEKVEAVTEMDIDMCSFKFYFNMFVAKGIQVSVSSSRTPVSERWII